MERPRVGEVWQLKSVDVVADRFTLRVTAVGEATCLLCPVGIVRANYLTDEKKLEIEYVTNFYRRIGRWDAERGVVVRDAEVRDAP